MKSVLDKLLVAFVAALVPIKMVLITVGILIMVDLITGIWAAKKRGERISSAVMRRTVSKFLIYQTTIITGFLLQTYLLDNIIPVSKLVASVIGLVEFKSILENGNSILGEDLFKVIIQKLGSDNDKKG